MTRVRNLIAGGALVAGITAAGPYVVQMYQARLEHAREMAAIQQSAEQEKRRAMCERDGGKWWRGECLEVTVDEPAD
jgi:hypothetical protein